MKVMATLLLAISAFADELTPQQSLELREAQITASYDQVAIGNAYIAYLQASAKAEKSQAAVVAAAAKVGKEAGCEVDLATAKCKAATKDPAPQAHIGTQ